MKFARKTCVMLLVLAAPGCAVFGSSALQKDPNFREGYEDGCAAATDQGSDLRHEPAADKDLLASNDAYRQGWNGGFQNCRRSEIEPNAAPGDNPVRLPGPGH